MKLGDMTVSPDVAKLNPGINAVVQKTTPPSKFHNCRTEYKGMLFDSGKEAAGVSQLILADEQHFIFGLRLQVIFPLYGSETYRADAVYSEVRKGVLQVVVKDFKGMVTRDFRRKAKAFKEIYGVEITTE